MIIYKDVITQDEVFGDSYNHKLVDDIVYEVEGKIVSEKDEIDEAMIGGNPSAEEAGEGLEVATKTGPNFVFANRLVSTNFSKKEYTVYIKEYMKKIKKYLEENNPDRVDAFMKGAQTKVKEILGNFKDYEFYMGESMDPEGMICLVNFRDDGVTPYMVVFKDGLIGEKF